jgi:hypothetical protein
MKPKTLRCTAIYVFAVIALAALALVPASPAAAVDLGFDVRFTGVIKTVGSGTVAWVIGGQTLATDETTLVVKSVEPVTSGLWADVAAKKLADGKLLARQITVRREQVRLRGVLTSKPQGNVGDWEIAGVVVKVTADTKIGSRSGEVATGKWVEAVMTEGGGVLTAIQILAVGDQDAVTVSGEIQQVKDDYWLVSGIKLLVQTGEDTGTLISGTPVVGLIAHAAAQLQDDDTLLADVLRVAWIDRTAIQPALKFTGTVTQMQAAPLPVGILEVTTKDPAMTYNVVITPRTRVHQEKGLLVEGATVHVIGWQVDQSKVIANEITVLDSPEEGGEFAAFRGVIKSLPAEGKLGLWLVGEQQILVDVRTLLLGGTPTVGAWVVGSGIERADGTILAGQITVFAPRN